MSKYCLTLLFLTLSGLSSGLAQRKKLDSLINEYKLLEQKPVTFSTDTSKILLLNDISRYAVNFNIDADKGLNYAQQALVLSEKNKWSRGQVESYYSIGQYYENLNNDTVAINNYQKALAIAIDKKVKTWEANFLHAIGEVYYVNGNYPVALDHFLRSLKLSEEGKGNIYVAREFTFIGNVYAQIGDNLTAIKYYEQALKRYEEIKNRYWIAINLQNIAAAYANDQQYENALAYYSRILEMMKRNVYSTYLTFIDMGHAYRHQLYSGSSNASDSSWEKAMDYYSRGLKVATGINDESAAGTALNGLGWLYLQRKNLGKADESLKKALTLLNKAGTPETIKDCYLNLSQLDSLKGNWKSSLAHYKLYTAIDDSLFDRKKSRQMTQLQIKYETDKKQGEIETLNKDNELKSLRITQQQKNILLIIAVAIILLLAAGGFIYYRNKKLKQEALKQISEAKLASLKSLMDKHFIFSSLHSIDTFLMNNDSAAASDYLVKYSKLIRSILEMSNQAEVSLEEEVSLCRSYLDLEMIRLENSFDYEFSIDRTLSMQQVLFPSMLLQPLVENAVKHGIGSLREEGKKGFIKIDINREKDKLVCSVTDNGKGLQFTSNTKTHRSYSGKGIVERVKVYNSFRKNRASFLLKDNNPGVTAVLTLPYLLKKQSVAV